MILFSTLEEKLKDKNYFNRKQSSALSRLKTKLQKLFYLIIDIKLQLKLALNFNPKYFY